MAGSITTDAAYTSEVIKTTVRASLEAIPGGIDGHPASVSFADGQQQSSAIVAVVVLSSVLVLATILLIKKRKHNN